MIPKLKITRGDHGVGGGRLELSKCETEHPPVY